MEDGISIDHLYNHEKGKWWCLKHNTWFMPPNNAYLMGDKHRMLLDPENHCPVCSGNFFLEVEFTENGERIRMTI